MGHSFDICYWKLVISMSPRDAAFHALQNWEKKSLPISYTLEPYFLKASEEDF
ncbi:MAG: hypothetical protein HYS08_09065 [Chlamydiae bacterium]|nr:hypothetical protein [Chlamydiota bacterium]MBI3265512.1 hypothetical protein [Chlamydiota bacterium]